MNDQLGRLYVVATPIGNLGDISQRALDVLGRVAAIAAEDTRHTRRLLSHYGIKATLVAYHEHNEAALTPRLLARLAGGDELALVSDAGTPLISDPGFVLVQAARERGIPVSPIPGPSAVITALSASGLPSDRFLFLGFPPRTSTRCRSWLGELADEPGTLIFYESGKRAVRTLEDLGAALGGRRRAVIARELTKQFETFLSGTLTELAELVRTDDQQRRGELVILVEGAGHDDEAVLSREQARMLGILADALPLKQAAELAARITGARRNELYALGLQRTAETSDPPE
jgi:16S rRNA (cytidine1402-2'-O)-methyltransferase